MVVRWHLFTLSFGSHTKVQTTVVIQTQKKDEGEIQKLVQKHDSVKLIPRNVCPVHTLGPSRAG